MLRSLINRVTCGLTLVLLCGDAFAADGTSVLHRCWTPEQLAAKAGEKASRRRHFALDKAALGKVERSPVEPVAEALRGSIRSVKLRSDRKLVALTLDLCETPYSIAGYDGALVDYLREQGVRATFFASGKWLESHAERAQQLLADPLFEIGGHGLEHRDARRIRGVRLNEEITLTRASYQRARARLEQQSCLAPQTPEQALAHVPREISLFRFPYGTCDAQALKAVAEDGLLAVQWDVVSGDPDKGRSARAIASTVLSRTKPGSIIVAHANGRGWNTAAALPLIVPQLRAQGYEFVTVSQLLAAGEPVVAQSCYENRPGDHRHFLTTRAPAKKKGSKKSAWPAFLPSAD